MIALDNRRCYSKALTRLSHLGLFCESALVVAPNLRSQWIDEISVQGILELPSEKHDAFLRITEAHRDKRRTKIPRVQLYSIYMEDDTPHLLTLSLFLAVPDSFLATIGYSVGPPGAPPGVLLLDDGSMKNQPIGVIDGLLNELDSLALRGEFHCTIDWEFAESLVRPVVQLPLISFFDKRLPFSDISGVRLRKLDDDQVVETAVLDLRLSGDLHLGLHFDHTGQLGKDLIPAVLQDANVRMINYVSQSLDEEEGSGNAEER